MVGYPQGRPVGKFLVADFDDGCAWLDDVNGCVQHLGERQDLRLTTPSRRLFHGVAIVHELGLGVLGLGNTSGRLVQIRNKRHKIVGMLPHVAGCRTAHAFVCIRLLRRVSNVELIGNRIVETVAIRRDLMYLQLQLLTQLFELLLFDLTLVHLWRFGHLALYIGANTFKSFLLASLLGHLAPLLAAQLFGRLAGHDGGDREISRATCNGHGQWLVHALRIPAY